jgi:hypothetical protein
MGVRKNGREGEVNDSPESPAKKPRTAKRAAPAAKRDFRSQAAAPETGPELLAAPSASTISGDTPAASLPSATPDPNTARAQAAEPKSAPVATRSDSRSVVDRRDLHHRIAELAYFYYEQRGYASGYELQDWLEAERIILAETAGPRRDFAQK